MVYETDMYI